MHKTRFDELMNSLAEYEEIINKKSNAKIEIHLKNNKFSIALTFFRSFNFIKKATS
jgi:hypothetical protein